MRALLERLDFVSEPNIRREGLMAYLQHDSLPPALRPLLEAAVADATAVPKGGHDLVPLYEWIEAVRWDDVVGPWWTGNGDAFVVKAYDIAYSQFTDGELRASEGLAEEEPVTDTMRAAFGRERIQYAIDNGDGYECPTVHCVPIRDTSGTTAVLGCLIEIHGQAGPVCVWHGPFKTEADFKAWLRDSGHVFGDEVGTLRDKQILDLWEKAANDAGQAPL